MSMRRVVTELGRCLRETGQALDRQGMRAAGDYSFNEKWSRHRNVMHIEDKRPSLSPGVWVAPNATVVGDVDIDDDTSVWYGAVIRGDSNTIKIGTGCNIQDGAVVAAAEYVAASGFPTTTTVGNFVTVGHGATLHSCTVETLATIGMNSVVLDGAVVERGAIVAAGSVVAPGRRVPAGQLWAGNPAVYVRDLTEEEGLKQKKAAEDYVSLKEAHSHEAQPYGQAYRDAEQVRQAGGTL